MGGYESKVIPDSKEIEYFGLVLLEPDKINAVNVNPHIVGIIQASLNRFGLIQSERFHDNTTYRFKLNGSPFRVGGGLFEGANDADNVRSFFCDLFANMFNQGWETVISSDLAQCHSNSTIIFRRRRSRPDTQGETNAFVCVSPSSYDKLSLIHVPKEIAGGLLQTIGSSWPLQEQILTGESAGMANYRLKMSGNPWQRCTGEDATQLRLLLLNIIRYMRQHKFKLKINANMKGTADTMFFQYDANQFGGPEDLFILYLSKNDRLRLLGSPEYIIGDIREEIMQKWGQGMQEERRHHGAYEFKLRGNPWWASGTETTESRFLMSNIITRLRSKGWQVHGTLDISRRLNDKSVFVFRQGPPAHLPWLCLSFHEADKIRYMAQQGIDLRVVVAQHLHSTTCGAGLVQRTRNYGLGFEWKVRGSPFSGGLDGLDSSSRDAQAVILHILMNVLRDLDRLGWTLVASADISSKYVSRTSNNHTEHYPLDVHSWFLLREGDLNQVAANPPGYSAAAGPSALPRLTPLSAPQS